MLPRIGSSKVVSAWITATLVASVVAILDGGFLQGWLALAPERIWRGEVWRLVTWPLIAISPISIAVTCAAIYKLGGDLAVKAHEGRSPPSVHDRYGRRDLAWREPSAPESRAFWLACGVARPPPG